MAARHSLLLVLVCLPLVTCRWGNLRTDVEGIVSKFFSGLSLNSGLFERSELDAAPSGLTCKLKDAVIQEQTLFDLVGYICSTGVDCGPIHSGGSKYPCTPYDCANYAVGAFFEKNYPSVEYTIDTTCYFKGVAQTSARVNHFFVEVHSTALQQQDNNVNVVNEIADLLPGLTKSWIAKNVTLKYDVSLMSTFFQGFWVARSAEDAAGCKVTAAVRYDFDGDGKYERTETYTPRVLGVTPAYQNYNSGEIPAPTVSGAYLQDMANGAVEVSLKTDSCSHAIQFLQGALNGPPASITIPYK